MWAEIWVGMIIGYCFDSSDIVSYPLAFHFYISNCVCTYKLVATIIVVAARVYVK